MDARIMMGGKMYSMTWKAIACIYYQYAFWYRETLFPLLKTYERPKVTMGYTVTIWNWVGRDVVSRTWQDWGSFRQNTNATS